VETAQQSSKRRRRNTSDEQSNPISKRCKDMSQPINTWTIDTRPATRSKVKSDALQQKIAEQQDNLKKSTSETSLKNLTTSDQEESEQAASQPLLSDSNQYETDDQITECVQGDSEKQSLYQATTKVRLLPTMKK
jgi:hypothetical protein